RTTRNLSGLCQLVIHLDCDVRRQCESKPRKRIRLGNDRGIDPDDFADHVHQWATAVSWIDCSVGLKKTLELSALGARTATGKLIVRSALGADDSGSHGVVESKRTSNGNHPIAGFYGIRVAELSNRQILACIDFDDRKVGVTVAADQPSGIFRFIGKLDRDFCGVLNYVMVGENVSGLIDNESGSRGFHGFRIVLGSITEEATEVLTKWAAGICRIPGQGRSTISSSVSTSGGSPSTTTTASARTLTPPDRRNRFLGGDHNMNIDDGRLQFLSDLRKGVRHGDRIRYGQDRR